MKIKYSTHDRDSGVPSALKGQGTKEWYDWSHAVPVDDFEVQRWINQCVENVREEAGQCRFPAFYRMASGNRIVYAVCWNAQNTIEVMVSSPVHSVHVPREAE